MLDRCDFINSSELLLNAFVEEKLKLLLGDFANPANIEGLSRVSKSPVPTTVGRPMTNREDGEFKSSFKSGNKQKSIKVSTKTRLKPYPTKANS